MTNATPTNKRKFTGTVVSNAMDKTAVVLVESVKVHPTYHKQYTSSRKYKVHDEKNEAMKGQTVVFEETRPLSKTKRWRLVEIKK
jgi:small subunit ribosomal protein S17